MGELIRGSSIYCDCERLGVEIHFHLLLGYDCPMFQSMIRFFLVVVLGGGVIAAEANEYQQVGLPLTQSYDPDDFGAHVQNWAVTQGSDGRIYVGNGNGLLAWDGEQWHRYSTPNQSRVRALLEWHDGRIYVGTVNDIGYYAADEKGVMSYTSLLDPETGERKLFGETWSIAATDEYIIFNTDKQVYSYNGESLVEVSSAQFGAGRLFNLHGQVFLFTDAGQTVLISPADLPQVQDFSIPGLPTGIKVRDILNGPAGEQLIVTAEHGVYSWTDVGAKVILPAESFGDGVDIYSGFRASDGYYYLGSRRSGLFVLNPDFTLLRRYGRKDGTGLDTVLDISEDKQGGIWFSGLPGVSRMIPPHLYSDYGSKQQNIGFPDLYDWRGEPMLAAFSIYQLAAADNILDSPKFMPLPGWDHRSNSILDLGTEALVAATGGVFNLQISSAGKLVAEPDARPVLEVMFANHLVLAPAVSASSYPAVYVATSAGLYRLEKSLGYWQSVQIPGIDEPLLYLSFDPQGNLWAGTSNQRMFLIAASQLAQRQPQVVLFDSSNGLGSNNVYPFTLADKFYIGTDNGLYDYSPERQPEFQPAPGFPEIFSTPEKDFFRWLVDSKGNFWYRIGNHTGVAWRQADGSYLADEKVAKPLPNRSATGFFEAADGAILISQADGGVFRLGPSLATGINPAMPAPGSLRITQVSNLDNGEVLYGGYGPVQIPELSAEASSLRVNFALSDFSLPEKTLYRSRLSGSDTWTDWQRETWRDFTRLQGGQYQFELQAKDGWGREQSLENFSFRVLPPWYLSPLAWVLYAITLVLALLLAAWLGQRLRTARLQQRNIQLQEVVAERTSEVRAKVEELEQQQELKDRFFANVSHEFRTPLTLTIEPLEEVVREHSKSMDDQGRNLTEIALRNARKMLGLIGQVLDINRLDAGRVRLVVAEYDIADLLRRIAQRFQPWLKRQQQSLVLVNTDDPVMLWFDQDQLDRCISNLVSNAIKYSGKGSRIELALNNKDKFVDVVVSDNGAGISADQREKVFERYFQGKQSSQHVWPGTGIGLALVRELMNLHKGSVELEDTTVGASFRLQLLRGCAHFSKQDINRDGIDESKKAVLEQDEPKLTASFLDGEDVTTILVVDDNAELRHFLSLRLATRYRVLEAENGRLGVEKAVCELPDLVISDVMMPEMTGIELARELKQNSETATIPLILLTAKSTKRDTVEGLEAGADDYLTKPFDTSELIARVAGLIASRRLIRVTALQEFQKNQYIGVSTDSFQQQLDKVILENIHDSNLNVMGLADLLSMERTTLYRKCQKSIEMSPIAYLRLTRMRVAAQLLRQGDMSVSEVAYATGFESISYFSRVFRAEYKLTPSAFS